MEKKMSRDINRMDPLLKIKYSVFKEEMEKAKIPFIITSVDRNILEQMALYVQNRLPLKDVNIFRKQAGLYLFKSEAENVGPVTWTLDSLHVVNNFDSMLDNDLSRAFDIAIIRDGKAEWNLKADVNDNNIADYKEAAEIGRKIGLVPGIDFGDAPHYQLF